MSKLQEMSQNWLDKCYSYRPSAFWFWNDSMEPDGIRDTIEEMAANNIREFLIHPVHGMTLEYLSDEFFERYRLALQLAKKNGLKVWIYDEYSWPSGSAGGKLLEDHPEHNGWLLHVSKGHDGEYKVQPARCDLVMDNAVGAPWTTSPRGYVDTLSQSAVECFVNMTHERFYHELGELFDEVVVGFFTDEPVVRMGCTDSDEMFWNTPALPWTPELPRWFKDRFGYDIEPFYSDLIKPEFLQVKRDYWDLVKDKHADIYHGQVAEWCQKHGVKYTGHLGEASFFMQVRFSGSVYQCLSKMDIPGIDFLGGDKEPDDRFIEQTMVTSVTRHCGHSKTYCEAYGVSPFSLKLGQMLRQAQMFGLHGINDIALMGFQQSQRGIRKHTYWPPMFRESPWWEFYGEFRNEFARSIGLVANGIRKARYALLYPQNAAEQESPFTPVWGGDYMGEMFDEIGLAIYAAGETFEFVFPEMLDQAKVVDGKIVFPYADYDAIIACSDLEYFPTSNSIMDDIASLGGNVIREPLSQIKKTVNTETASWADIVQIEYSGPPGSIRVYRIEYEDGTLFALRNVTSCECQVNVTTEMKLAQWDIVSGNIKQCGGKFKQRMSQYDTVYLSVTDIDIANDLFPQKKESIEVECDWEVVPERKNLAALDNLKFRHKQQGWVDAVLWSIVRTKDAQRINGVPNIFRGSEGVQFTGSFRCANLTSSLGLVFERDLIESLEVNGQLIDLSQMQSYVVWDASCVYIEISHLIVTGENIVTGKLKWDRFETEIVNDNFFGSGLMMPACDIFVAGDFRFTNSEINSSQFKKLSTNTDLSLAGWSQFIGVLQLNTTLEIDLELAKEICGIEFNLLREDSIEVLLDGKSLGVRVSSPYCFDIPKIAVGKHDIAIRISSTSEGMVGDQSKWGVKAIRWLK